MSAASSARSGIPFGARSPPSGSPSSTAWSPSGQTLWSGLDALWDSIVLGAQESWNSIVASVSGLGQRVSTALSEMWNASRRSFSELDLFESGARLLDTFVEGIKSKVSSLVSTVENALASVREYLPFSDAHTGPLSQLTLSGTRMMTTLGEGVGQGAPALLASVSGALVRRDRRFPAGGTGCSANRRLRMSALRKLLMRDLEIGENSTMRAAPKNPRRRLQSWTITIQELHLPNVVESRGRSYLR